MSDDPAPAPHSGEPAARGARRRERTRLRILDATEDLMTMTPIEYLRLEDVAVAAGVSPASIYTHFGTKDGLTAAVVNRVLAEVVRAFDTTAFAAASPAERVRQIGFTYIGLLQDHPAIASYLAVAGLKDPGSAQEERVAADVLALRLAFEEHIAQAVADGDLAGVDPSALGHFMFGGWLGVAALTLRQDALRLDRDEAAAVVATCWTAMMAGMEAVARER